MTKSFQFGIALRRQYPLADDIHTRFEELVEQDRMADRLGYDSITKTSHHSTHPFQTLQQLPVLARLTAEAPNVRLNAGIVLLSLYTPLEIAEQLTTIDVMSGGRLIFGAALGYRDVEFKAFGSLKSGTLLSSSRSTPGQLLCGGQASAKMSLFVCPIP